MEIRTCKKCNAQRPLSEFREYVRKGRRYWGYECRPCGNAAALATYHRDNAFSRHKARERYAADPGAAIEKTKAWYRKNRERAIARSIKNRAKNRSVDQAASRKWRAANPVEARLLAKARRARVRGAKVEKIRKTDLSAILARQGGKCAVCAAPLIGKHLDHVMPLALGGEHALRNLQYLCPPCNLSKSAKHPVAFMQSKGFLI